MAKTARFSRLRNLHFLSSLARREGSLDLTALRAVEREQRMARREFAERVLAGLGALTTGQALSACGHSTADESSAPEDVRIAIIGAGMAGIACAHHLETAGVTATLYEASDRIGGRMYTARGMFADEQVAELGGELIDTGHMVLRNLAKQLDIELDDRDDAIVRGKADAKDVWWVKGKAVPESVIVEQFGEVADLMKREMEAADSDDSAFARLDETPMDEWLAQNLAKQPELHSVLVNAYRGEYGLELNRQSTLNLLYLIGSDDPSSFAIFGDSDERFHTHLGSSTFPETLAKKLASPILRKHRLVAAEDSPVGGSVLVFDTPDGRKRVTADFVVFALPFSVLRAVNLDGLSLSAEKRHMIQTLGYGTNAKIMGGFTRRVWLEDHRALGSITADEPFQQTWDTSLGQAGKSGLMTNFVGGEQGVRSGEGSAEAWFLDVALKGLEKVFPGCEGAYVKGSAVRMHWPTYPFNRASYACYEPGQWSFWGKEGAPERDGTLQFCGEHTSLEFQGYMEGAAETGLLVAGAILESLGIAPSEGHQALLSIQRSVPQPAFGEVVVPRFRSARLRALERAWGAVVR